MDIKEKFGNKVRQVRLSRGLSQEQLAFISNLHRTYISGVERGLRNVSLDNIERIAKALNISIGDLMNPKNNKRKSKKS